MKKVLMRKTSRGSYKITARGLTAHCVSCSCPGGEAGGGGQVEGSRGKPGLEWGRGGDYPNRSWPGEGEIRYPNLSSPLGRGIPTCPSQEEGVPEPILTRGTVPQSVLAAVRGYQNLSWLGEWRLTYGPTNELKTLPFPSFGCGR